MKKIIVFSILINGIIFGSCNSKSIKELQADEIVITNPTYTKDIEPIFKSQCTSCHGVSGTQQYPNLETYDEVKDAIENGVVICRIDNPDECSTGKVMPQSGKMPQKTIDLIKLWKTQGFIN